MPAASIARVLIDSPLPQLDRLFDYRITPEQREDAKPGCRVRVPLRSARRIADGFIIEIVDSVDYRGVLSELDSVVSGVPVLSNEVYSLARSVADRAAGSASDIVRIAVPKRQVRVEKAWLATHRSVPEVGDVPAAVPEYSNEDIDRVVADSARVAVEAIPRLCEVSGSWIGHWAVTMAAMAARALRKGSVILIVPDYRDQTQLELALSQVLSQERVVRLDARQSNPDRYRAHLACLEEGHKVIIGNRSSVYAPARNLALIALWSDGDSSLVEPLAPYVHCRDAALLRQEQQNCALVFVNHARTVEVERLVQLGWCRSLSPEKRYLPRVILTAQQEADSALAARARIPSTAWQEAREALKTGPVLVQVARPGYAPRLVCESCGQVSRCEKCTGPLQVRHARASPACSWCGALSARWRCGNCAGTRYRMQGQGVERTAEDLGRAFPGVQIVVADGERHVLEIGGRPALVIATRGAEPIAAGGYRAVILLDGERMLARESLRVAEDCLRWWSSAIALAAVGAPSVLVGVGGSLGGALATWQLDNFARTELADRRRLRFPPAIRVATVFGDFASVERALSAVANLDGVDTLGPVDTEPGRVRAIVRLDFNRGSVVASALRAEVIRNASSRRTRVTSEGARAPAPTLRVRFDDLEPFEQL